MKALYQLVFGWLLRHAPRKDHLGAAVAHLLYGLHNRVLGLCPRGTTCHATLHGFDFILPAGHLLPLYLAENPRQEKPLLDLVSAMQGHGAPEDFVMVDVGANIGDTAIPSAMRAPRGTFLCIEGSPEFFPHLVRNVDRAEMTGRFHLREVLCGEPEDVEQGFSIETNFGSGVVKRGGGSTAAGGPSVATLDHLLGEAGLSDRVSLIKIDTDGFDYRVLRGGRNGLARTHPVLFFELAPTVLHDQGEDPMAIFPMLRECGYTNYLLYTNFGEFFGHGRFDEPAGMDFLKQAIDYALRHRRFFYDIVVLGERHGALRDELLAAARLDD